MKRSTLFLLILAALLFTGQPVQAGEVDHPSKLTYKPLTYDPPRMADFRAELPNGMVVYIQEDSMLPTLDLEVMIRAGSLYDPADKIGLAEMAGEVMRKGGTPTISGEDLDERLAFLGASIRTSMGGTSGNASLSVLIKDQEEGLKLFADVLMHPAFPEDKMKLYKDQAIHSLKSRNDSASRVLGREFSKLLYGDHPLAREETQASIEGITQADLLAFHEKYFAPNNMILAVAGDFKKEEMLEEILAAFEGWPAKEIDFPQIPEVEVKDKPGVFMVQKETNQGYVSVGHFGIKDTNPDIFAINIMNFIVGGGSFTSRITTKVRSDEGLAYNTGCRFSNRHLFPGTFTGYVQTKSETVHYAISLILAEFHRIRNEEVSDEEMDTAKNFYIDSFPSRFSSPIGTMGDFANLEFKGFPFDYYETYRANYEKVTKEDVLRVAQKYILPERMSIFVVGDIEPCKAGYEKHPGTLDELGPITIIELKDPLTGQ